MSKFNLDELLKANNPGLKLVMFDNPNGGGLVLLLIEELEHASAIEGYFNAPAAASWSCMRHGLEDLKWFPIAFANAFCEDVEDAIVSMKEKLQLITALNPDYDQWLKCVRLLGILINEDRHEDFLYRLSADSDLMDCAKAVTFFEELL